MFLSSTVDNPPNFIATTCLQSRNTSLLLPHLQHPLPIPSNSVIDPQPNSGSTVWMRRLCWKCPSACMTLKLVFLVPGIESLAPQLLAQIMASTFPLYDISYGICSAQIFNYSRSMSTHSHMLGNGDDCLL